MAFNGIYNITLGNGPPSPDSASVALTGSGSSIGTVPYNPDDVTQRWIVVPVDGSVSDAYIIHSAYDTKQYINIIDNPLIPTSNSAHLWIIPSSTGFGWIADDTLHIRISTTASTNWLPNATDPSIIVTGNTQYQWTLTLVPSDS